MNKVLFEGVFVFVKIPYWSMLLASYVCLDIVSMMLVCWKFPEQVHLMTNKLGII